MSQDDTGHGASAPGGPVSGPGESAPSTTERASGGEAAEAEQAREKLSADERKAAREQLASDLPEEAHRLLLDLSTAFQKFAMYPKGHPAVEPSLERVSDRLQDLFALRTRVTITVGRDHLTIFGARTDVENPLLRTVARRLHAHHILAMTFRRGVQPEEIAELLDVLSRELGPDDEPLGLAEDEALNQWPHVHLQPLDYDPLKIADREDEAGGESEEAILSQADLPFETEIAGMDLLSASASDVAERIQNRLGSETTDRMIALQVFQLGEELLSAGGKAGDALRGRMSELVMTLDSGSLSHLLEVGRSGGRREKFLVDTAKWMGVDAVLQLIRTAAQGREGDIAPWLLRVMQKMGRHVPPEAEPYSSQPDSQMRDLVHRLVQDWELEDPRPGGYSEVLEDLTRGSPVTGDGQGRGDFEVQATRVVQMAIELDEPGPAAERAVGLLIDEEDATELLDMMERAPEGNRVAEFLWEKLSTPEAVGQLLRSDNPNFTVLDRILDRLGVEVAEPMIEVFIESKSRNLRRKLFDRLASLGPEVAPLLAERLDDERWWVQRNLLSLLVEIGAWPEELDLAPFLQHEDRRVRVEAFKLALVRDSAREWAICTALRDDDQRLVTLGLAAAEESCPAAAESFVIRALKNETLPDQIRAHAARALGNRRSPQALKALREVCLTRKWFFWKTLAPRSPLVLQAIRVLARNWPEDDRAWEVIDRALESDDPEIERAASGAEPTAEETELDLSAGELRVEPDLADLADMEEELMSALGRGETADPASEPPAAEHEPLSGEHGESAGERAS